jgi:UPF0176 protein|tara:strand:+ start:2460 stop:3359 length:900 start_codon:yes stop_codon:yes gene_type:complete
MYHIFGFYKFKKLKKLSTYKKVLNNFFLKKNIRGTLIISSEGINGTISGKKKDLNLATSKIQKVFNFTNFDNKNMSINTFQPFHRSKIKIKNEVVPMGIKIKSRKTDGHLSPKKWNQLICDKNTLLIDARKPFENEVGSFKNSLNPNITNFRQFPKFLKNLDKRKSIAMFCTGGIRCEKASVFLEKKGFKNIYQLKGGIINYFKNVDKSESLWKGECFVFDNRISLNHNLKPGSYSMCSGCRNPISKQDKKSKKYEEGVSCPKCHDTLTNTQKDRFRMRQKQINVAKKTGNRHIFQKEY